ncbi:acyltransferase, partial [Pedobacter sp. HMWF019]|uniref:acyltransferase family protein n=1 Tax=Pedobacter sp. HMWF019 TaxID=2056856 RepID=UPI000D48A18F
MQNKLQKLESLRGFAAVYVILHHLFNAKCIVFNHDISFLFKFGQEAVMLFFILSGFVIHYSFQRSADRSFRTFLKKRFLRIYIPLIIVFIISYILYLS